MTLTLLLSATLLGVPAGAQTAPARLQVHGEATYDPEARWITARQVRFEQGPVTIESDHLEVDLALQRATFTGRVRLETENGRWEGEVLAYDLVSGSYTADQGRAELQIPGAEGMLRLQVPAVAGTPDRVQMVDARLTTCGCGAGPPEYHVRAREIEIEPGVRMVLRHVVYVEGSVPLFYWPRLTVSLDPEDELGSAPFQPPEFGWTEEDGWYLRATYAYDTREAFLGTLHMAYYQLSGWGLGVTQRLPLGPAAWEVGVDWLQNPPSEVTGRTEAEPRYRLQTRLELPAAPEAPVRASYQATYEEWRPGGIRGDGSLEHDLSVTAEAGGAEADVRAHQERAWEDGETVRREGADMTARQALGPFTLALESHGRRWETSSSAREAVGYQGEVTTRWSGWDAALRAGWTLHPDLLAYRSPGTWSRFGRSPEAELGYTLPASLWPEPLQGTRLRLSLQHGRYAEEDPAGLSTGWVGATHLEARSSGTRLPLGKDLGLGVGAWAGGWGYASEQALSYAGSAWTLQYRPGGSFTGEVGYTVQRRWGVSPFAAHEEAWKDKEEAELLLEADFRPLRVGAYASYDVRDAQVEDLAGLMEVRPSERFEMGAAGHYDLPDQTWTRYDARLAVGLTENWWLEGAAAYVVDPDDDRPPLRGQVSLTYTSDCRTVGLRFDLAARALWFEYRLHAFPASPLLWGREPEDATLFDLPDMKAVARQVSS